MIHSKKEQKGGNERPVRLNLSAKLASQSAVFFSKKTSQITDKKGREL